MTAKKERDPSLHIKRSDLKKVLKSVLMVDNVDQILDEIIVKGHRYSISSRSISISNQYAEKKLTKLAMSSVDDTITMSDCIWAYRTGKLKHRGIKKINQDSKEWGDLKEFVNIANEFYDSFSEVFKSKREAYINYMDIAIPKISSTYGFIRKLINMYEYVGTYKDSEHKIKSDKKPNITKSIHDYYCRKISDKTGIATDYKNDLNKYVYFLEVRLACDKLEIDYIPYIDAQFESLVWRNGIPEPSMLVGEKATERLNKFIYENNLNATKKDKKAKSSLGKLKNIK